ncbi:MAG: BrnT family toxin [Terracidiphilus sp.]
MKVRFERDPAKAAANLRKHGVSFQTAARVFADSDALLSRTALSTVSLAGKPSDSWTGS